MHKTENLCEKNNNYELYEIPIEEEPDNHNSADLYKSYSNCSPLIDNKGHMKKKFFEDRSFTALNQKFSKSQEINADGEEYKSIDLHFPFLDFSDHVVNQPCTKSVIFPSNCDTPMFSSKNIKGNNQERIFQKRKKSRLSLIRKEVDPRNSSTQILAQLETLNHICKVSEIQPSETLVNEETPYNTSTNSFYNDIKE